MEWPSPAWLGMRPGAVNARAHAKAMDVDPDADRETPPGGPDRQGRGTALRSPRHREMWDAAVPMHESLKRSWIDIEHSADSGGTIKVAARNQGRTGAQWGWLRTVGDRLGQPAPGW